MGTQFPHRPIRPILASVAAVGLLAGPVLAAETPTMPEAAALVQAGEYAAAADAYRQITAAQPPNARAWVMLGYALHADKKYEEALAAYARAATFPQSVPIAMYNTACVRALTGDADAAFEALGTAAGMGVRDRAQYESDADLVSLHADERWGRLLERLDGLNAHPPETLLHFWVGSWDCYDAASAVLAGRNELVLRSAGKAVHESWTAVTGNAGSVGESWNWYDPQRGVWRQVWVDQGGGVVDMVGTHDGSGGVLFEGASITPVGTSTLVRMHVRPIGEGRVRQTGTGSDDNGQTWQPRYDLVYVPRGEVYPPEGAGG